MSPEDCERIAKLIIRHRPVGIVGYAAALDLLGRSTQHHREALRSAGVKFVLSTAEMLPKADSHEMLRDVFNAPIVQELGGVEFGHVAMKHECEPWEVFPDLNILEARADADDVGGESAFVTTLYRRYTPWIRYQQGDLLERSYALSNGHVHRFDKLLGRVQDFLIMDDGRRVHSVALLHCVHQEPEVLNIQLVLRDGGPVLRLVCREPDQKMESRIRQRLTQVHPALGTTVFDYVQDLQTTIAGKRRWISDERRTRATRA
jgi:phenylacetate-coenzyme A ligase PaaK-like adenylate-forming protein